MKSFIICLSQIESSMSTAVRLQQQLKDYNIPVELFEGTYGNQGVELLQQEQRTIHPFGIKGPNPAPITDEEQDKQRRKILVPGVIGCFYSHYRLWQRCVELDEPIMIFEDDIVLSRPYIPVEFQDVLVVALGHPTKSERYMPYLTDPQGEPRASAYPSASMPGCCGYAIRPHAAKKLVTTYAKTFLPADNAINQYHVTIEIHNYIMGIALIKKDGKKSLTRTKFWSTYQ
jgi:GR25 family glycosyltransferase involved in LPS biosynthesis